MWRVFNWYYTDVLCWYFSLQVFWRRRFTQLTYRQNGQVTTKQKMEILKFVNYYRSVWYVCLNNSFQFFWKYMWVKKYIKIRVILFKTENIYLNTCSKQPYISWSLDMHGDRQISKAKGQATFSLLYLSRWAHHSPNLLGQYWARVKNWHSFMDLQPWHMHVARF